MSPFEFPRNPGVDRPNPFEDEKGKNPFGDDAQVEPDAEAEDKGRGNPYLAQQVADVQPYRPDPYEAFLPHRGRFIFWTGVIGFGLQITGLSIAALAILVTGDFLEGIVFGLPGNLAGLAVCIPAWVMGHSDWIAMESGAMQSAGSGGTRSGLRLGIAGTMVGAVQLLLFFGVILHNAFFV